MPRVPRIPRALTRGVFTLADARQKGIDRWHLRGTSWRKLGPGTFVAARVDNSPLLRLDAAMLRLPDGAVFSGLTAAWLHGLDVEPCDPIEVIAPLSVGISSRAGMQVRRCELPKQDVVKARGRPVTSILRTLRDLCLRLSLTEAVVIADMALHAGLTTTAALAQSAEKSSGQQGIRQLRKVVEFLEPKAESPMESRLRMLLVLAGLPRPEAQVDIRDHWHRFVARVDLYYRAQRVAIEYDGGLHRDRLVEDNRRQNRLLETGVRLLRFTAGDVMSTPAATVEQVRNGLHTNGHFEAP